MTVCRWIQRYLIVPLMGEYTSSSTCIGRLMMFVFSCGILWLPSDYSRWSQHFVETEKIGGFDLDSHFSLRTTCVCYYPDHSIIPFGRWPPCPAGEPYKLRPLWLLIDELFSEVHLVYLCCDYISISIIFFRCTSANLAIRVLRPILAAGNIGMPAHNLQ